MPSRFIDPTTLKRDVARLRLMAQIEVMEADMCYRAADILESFVPFGGIILPERGGPRPRSQAQLELFGG